MRLINGVPLSMKIAKQPYWKIFEISIMCLKYCHLVPTANSYPPDPNLSSRMAK